MRCQSLGGGGGVFALNEFLEKKLKHFQFLFFFCNIMITCGFAN